MPEATNPSPEKEPSHKLSGARMIGTAVLLLVGSYTAAVLAGLPAARRIDGATLGIIGIGVVIATILFRPEFLTA